MNGIHARKELNVEITNVFAITRAEEKQNVVMVIDAKLVLANSYIQIHVRINVNSMNDAINGTAKERIQVLVLDYVLIKNDVQMSFVYVYIHPQDHSFVINQVQIRV